jgi:hypothetical protein
MGLLLYKSDEMFSATELIRKSKMIFDKILDKDIEKAIILRDGKPSFLLMDFEKYETIMAEFEELKQQIQGKSIEKKVKQKEKKKESKKQSKKEIKTIDIVENEIELVSREEAEKVVVETPNIHEKPLSVVSQKIEEIQDENIETKSKDKVEEELTEEEELYNAFSTIEGMNFNDDMKKEAQDKIRIKILQARKERAELLEQQEQELQKEEEVELQLKQHIEEEKLNKERELKEFWD